jgi:Fuc2NAc and GlcNAc transferase
MGTLGLIGVAALAASLLLSPAVLRYARVHSLLDVPSERSSHTRPTPRGGGLGMVLVVLSGVAVLTGLGRLDPSFGAAMLGGGAMVALVGWLDDVRGVPARWRLAAHVVAALWAVSWLGGMPELTVGSDSFHLGAAGAAVAVLAVVWGINLYNFMDGIDGLAAAEAASVGLAATALLASRNPPLAAVAVTVAGAAAGFLPWNWQRARIFMGDVGSGFLGFLLATLTLASENAGAMPALVWLLLVGVFFSDATITLARRMLRRERWYAPHRVHAYQRAVQGGWSHARVTLAVLGLNGGLALLAWLCVRRLELLPPVLLLAGAALGSVYLVVERWRPMPRRSDAASMEKPIL